MELHKLSTADLRGQEATKLGETETSIRKELGKIRMDIYTARNQHTAKIRGLRKTLARLLTVRHEVAAKTPKAPKAAKAVVAPKAKPAKAVAPKTAPAKAKAAAADAKPKTAAKKTKTAK